MAQPMSDESPIDIRDSSPGAGGAMVLTLLGEFITSNQHPLELGDSKEQNMPLDVILLFRR